MITKEATVRRITGFDFTPDERAVVGVLVQEIETTFADHEPMPPEIGGVTVTRGADGQAPRRARFRSSRICSSSTASAKPIGR